MFSCQRLALCHHPALLPTESPKKPDHSNDLTSSIVGAYLTLFQTHSNFLEALSHRSSGLDDEGTGMGGELGHFPSGHIAQASIRCKKQLRRKLQSRDGSGQSAGTIEQAGRQ